jgi:hypothetical protein
LTRFLDANRYPRSLSSGARSRDPLARKRYLDRARCDRRIPTINHARAVFIENKRYRMKRRAIGDVVNRNAVSVYQTD